MMSTPSETIWPIEPHTIAKHRILSNYLGAWFPILSSYHGRIVYLDGFSGPGVYKDGEPGSPIIALNVALNHRRRIAGEFVFIFVDERADRVANLKAEISALTLPKHFKVYPEQGKFDETVKRILDELDHGGKSLAPAFVFVDPFGFSGVPFSLLKRLLSHDRSEAFITFMVDSMNRFLEVPNDEIKNHIVDFFGTEEVLGIPSLAGDRKKNLLNFYVQRIRSLVNNVRLFEMRNENDRTIYYLIFATKNPLGHLKMKEAMWRVDSEGQFRYSDSTNANQLVLFRADHSEQLCNTLRDKYTGKQVPSEVVRRWVRDETVYIDKHVTQALSYGETMGFLGVAEIKTDGKKRRPHTFPDGVLLNFK